MQTPSPFRSPALMAVLCLCCALLCPAAMSAQAAAAGPKKNFAVPAGSAETALKLFSEQSGLGVIFVTKIVNDVQTNAATGEFTAREALDRMVAGTPLVVTQDAKTGAFAVKRDAVPNAERVAQTEPSARPTQLRKTEDGTLQLEKFEVTGRKIDGIQNKGLIPTDANSAVYHEVISRVEIERMGITSFEELFRQIPQTSSGANGFQSPPSNVNISGGTVANISTVSLRGFASAQTLILINGRVQPRSGANSNGGTDLSRIPIAAIDRVEILPLSGSALYGGGALGGAINVILRKEYNAKELTTYIGTSWDGGATEYRVSYLDGRSFNLSGRKTTLTMQLDYSHRDPLYQGDRNYTARVLEKYGPNTTVRNAAGVSAFELFTLNAFAGSPATILVGNGPAAAINDLGIPGAPGLRWVQVPTGTTAAQSNALTPDSFTGVAGKFTPGERFAQQTIYQPQDNFSANLQFEHKLSDRLTVYSEFGAVKFQSKYTFPQVLTLNLTATDPLNPFRTNVTPGFVGRPIRVFFDPLDINDPNAREERDTLRGLLGIKGQFLTDWEWSLDGAYDHNRTKTRSNNTTNWMPTLLSTAGLTGTTNGQTNVPAPLDVRRAVYPVLADHRQFPVPTSDNDKYWYALRDTYAINKNFIGIGRVTGPIYQLPAGPINVAALGQYTKFDRVGGQGGPTSSDLWSLMTGFPFPETPLTHEPLSRNTLAGAAELVIPVFNDKWRPRFIPLQSMELNLSARREQFKSEFFQAASFTPLLVKDNKYGKSVVAATKVQLLRDVAVRYSYTTGIYPPDWSDFGAQIFTLANQNFLVVPDPKRGNTSQPFFTYTWRIGGNLDLRPEDATSQNFGLIYTPRFLKDFTLNVDYWKISKIDGIVTPTAATLVALSDEFPTRVVRAPLTPADAALGYTGGLLTLVDWTTINVAKINTDGIDLNLRYDLKTKSMGQFLFSANSSFTNKFETKATPTSTFLNTAGVSGPRRWRGRAAVTWSRDPWEVTFSSRYTHHYSTSTTAPTAALPTAFPLDGGRIPAFMRYDMQVSYQFHADTSKQGWKRWLSATKWTLGCQNILNDAPTLVSNGTSFYNAEDDPRQRYIYLSIRKSL